MSKPGDVVEFRSGLHGMEAPRNLAILLERRRVKGVAWVRLMTLDGPKEVKAEHLSKRLFRARYEGDLGKPDEVLARLRHLAAQHAGGALAEEPEDDLSRLEEALWEATCDQARPAWTEEEIAAAHYGAASPVQLRDARAALDRCRRPGIGRFQTVGGRGDRWRPWSRPEAEAMRKAWQDLQELRRHLVVTEETDEGRVFRAGAAVPPSLAPTLAWVKAAMAQHVEWDGVPEGEPVAGIGGLGAAAAFGMDLHRQLGFLAQDWTGHAHTSRSSDYVLFLLGIGAWSPQDAVDALVRRHVNQEEFFEHAEDPKAEALADGMRRPEEQADEGRTDLRHLRCHTIDPPDAKDFDDAVGLEDAPELAAGGVRLWVHVADVSHYVAQDTLLDRYAKRRATSVYLPGRVLPMLPHRLSDDLCSLRSDGDRFALSVGLDVAADGRITGARFHKALIRVTRNMHYGQALQARDASDPEFVRMFAVAQAMRSHRRGIELETGELRVLLGATGFSALEKRADDATRMIETFMVAANEAVAAHLAAEGVPLLFRCHPLPERAKAERLQHQLETMGVPVAMDLPAPERSGAAQAESVLDQLRRGGGKLSLFGGGVQVTSAHGEGSADAPEAATPPAAPPGFSTLGPQEQEAWLRPMRAAVQAITALPDERAEVATLKVLAAMGRAFYSPDNQGHYGLASTHYCHFTSPIRRYPDLVVHRSLKWLLAGRNGPPPHSQESLRALCDHCSNQERAADQLERRIKASCLVLASLEEGGGAAAARVTGLTPASLFVLRGDGIEARIASRDLPGGPYQADEWESMLFRGPREGEPDLVEWVDHDSGELRRVRVRLGDPVTVQLAGRDVAAGRTGAKLLRWS